jgi:hypothetical protein
MWNHITTYHCLLGAFSTTTRPERGVQHHIVLILIQLIQLLQWLYQHPGGFCCHFWNHIIFYCLWRTVLCNCKWVSDDYPSLVSISSAMSWREHLTLAQIIIMYAFFQTIALKVRNVSPLWHIIPTLNQPICLCPFFLMMLA